MEAAEVQLQGVNEATSCAACPAFEFGFCSGSGRAATESQPIQRCQPAIHSVPARRPICRAGEFLDAIPIICKGWAASTTTLPDGRRLILSVLLPGDPLSSALIFELEIRCSVEAITDVEYRTFDRGELKNLLLRNLIYSRTFPKFGLKRRVAQTNWLSNSVAVRQTNALQG